jgi:hypothetical protein
MAAPRERQAIRADQAGLSSCEFCGLRVTSGLILGIAAIVGEADTDTIEESSVVFGG